MTKAPRSEKRSQASRQNGAKSRGPSSADGKSRSAKNSRKHGLTGKINATQEEQGAVERMVAKLIARFGNDDPQVAALIERAITATLRLNRARALISEALEDIADPQNLRRTKAQTLNAALFGDVEGAMQQMQMGQPPSAILAEIVDGQTGYNPVVAHPNRAAVYRLMEYAQRFRGERDRALGRLESTRK